MPGVWSRTSNSKEPFVIYLGVPAIIPEIYITDLPTRLDLYQRLVKVDRLEQVKELESELLDRFGSLPFQTRNLIYLVTVKIKARIANIQSITRQNDVVIFQLAHEIGARNKKYLSDISQAISLGNTKIKVDIKQIEGGWEKFLLEIIDSFMELH